MVSDDRAPAGVQRWSTADVDPPRRLAYYTAATSAALVPLSITCASRVLDASAERAALGPLDILRMKGSAHGVVHGARHVARAGAHRYYLMLNVASGWAVAHGRHVLLAPGEIVFIDSALPYRLQLSAYEIVTVDMPPAWLQQWLRRPGLLAGQRLSSTSLAGRALAAMLPQLTPAFAVDSPLPGDFMAEQIGALLSALEGEMTGCAPLAGSTRCPTHETAAEAQHARAATRMLQSRMFRDVSLVEIARRAGYDGVADMKLALLRHGKPAARPSF
jgi:AraC family transcriptional activator of tynA and feaB